jgi:hypothetical protein
MERTIKQLLNARTAIPQFCHPGSALPNVERIDVFIKIILQQLRIAIAKRLSHFSDLGGEAAH